MSCKVFVSLSACSAALALSIVTPGVASGSAVAPTGQPQKYVYADLGVLGGLDSRASALNNGGQVVGHADTYPNSGVDGYHAFLWTPAVPNGTSGTMTDLGTLLRGGNSAANGINGSSVVVGESLSADRSTSSAFLYNGTMHDLGGFGGSYSSANSINAAGAVTGYSKTAAGYDHAFLWIPDKPGGVKGTMYDLGTPPGQVGSIGVSINNAGAVAGYTQDADFNSHAFIWRPDTPNGTKGTMAMVPEVAGFPYSGAQAVNDGGLIVGSVANASLLEHAFLYNGTMHDLGTLPGGSRSVAYSINSSGVAVGFSETAVRANDHAVIFADGRVTDLNRFLPGSAKAAGVVLTVARGVNDSGQITGYADVNGHAHAFLLSPAP